MKLAIIGSGYVGLVTGACLAETGHTVVGVDNDESKVKRLDAGEVPIYEPGLEDLLRRNMAKRRLSFTTNLTDAVDGAQAVFIAVGTPSGDDGRADLGAVLDVARGIGAAMHDYLVVITKSTVPVGTSRLVADAVREGQAGRGMAIDFDAASNPEFLKEGAAIEDFMKPDRVVVGVESDRAKAVIERIYRPFVLGGRPILFMDLQSAEITKYASNAMLATRISFMNQIAELCDAVGADVHLVRRGMGSDPRIGSAFLYAGLGFGGSCFPKDVRALIHSAAEVDVPMPILDAVNTVNDRQKHLAIGKLRSLLGLDPSASLVGFHVAVWGIAFKPNTDDVREAPALTVIDDLVRAGASVAVYDPVVLDRAQNLFGDRVRLAGDAFEAADGADALVLVTEWPEFRTPDVARLAASMRGRIIVDGRNVLDHEELVNAGFSVSGVGLGRTGRPL